MKREIFSIEKPSQELFLEALKTIPLKVDGGEVLFAVKDIVAPQTGNSPDVLRYLRDCEAKDVTPYKLRVEYNKNYDLFLPKSDFSDHTDCLTSLYVFRGSYSLLAGGKPYQVSVVFGKQNPTLALQNLQKKFLRDLHENSYEIKKGEIDFLLRLGDESDSVYSELGISFGIEGAVKGLQLHVGRRAEEFRNGVEKVEEAKKWFDGLKAMYD